MDLRDVQYGKIRNTRIIQYRIICNLGVPILPKMDPIRPKVTQNVPNSFPIDYVLLKYYIIALEAH